MNRRDSLNFLRKLTRRRLWNMTKVYTSFQLTRLFNKPIQWGLPITVAIEPTTACNLRCPECPSGLRAFTRKTGNLAPDFFRKVMGEIGKDINYLIFYFQGEPYINPDFLDMVQFASAKGVYTITSTNGHFLSEKNAKATIESGLDRIVISIDGTTQEVYEQYRKTGTLAMVLEGAKNIVHWKKELKSKTPHIVFQYLVVQPNEHQIEDAKKLADEIGVDEIKFKTAQIYDYKNGNPLIPTIDKYSRYRKNKSGQFELKNDLSNHCWRLWHSPVITWNGLVVPCCFDKDATHQLGDLRDTAFKEVWQNAEYQQFRKQVIIGRDQIDICKNCTEGSKVWS